MGYSSGGFGRLMAAGLVCGSAFVHQALADEMEVLESNVPQYKVGTILPDQPKLNLPPGGRVTVLRRPSNETRTFSEPSKDPRPGPLGGPRQPSE